MKGFDNMIKKILIIMMCLFAFTSCENKDIKEEPNKQDENNNVTNDTKKQIDKKKLNLNIEDKIYEVTMDDDFNLDLLGDNIPFRIVLAPYDEYFIYGYLPEEIEVSTKMIGLIKKGDVVIEDGYRMYVAIEDVVSTALYTKFGHIENLDISQSNYYDVDGRHEIVHYMVEFSPVYDH